MVATVPKHSDSLGSAAGEVCGSRGHLAQALHPPEVLQRREVATDRLEDQTNLSIKCLS